MHNSELQKKYNKNIPCKKLQGYFISEFYNSS